jgi:hypothetical protein
MTDKATQSRVIRRIFSEISPEAWNFAKSIGGANEQLKIYQILLLGGADAMREMQTDMARVTSSGGTQEQIKGWVNDLLNNSLKKYKDIAKALNTALNQTVGSTVDKTTGTKETIKTLADFITSITKANKSIGYQTSAFLLLTKARISASDALKLVQDTDLARILATEKDVKKRTQLVELLRTQLSLEKKLKEETAPEQTAIDNANKKINVLEIQNKLAQLGLDRISKQEDVINKAYDKRLESLDKIQQANKEIAAQQQDQLDLSSALAKGDMASAARAAQKLRASAAEKAMVSQRTALENSKAAAVAGVRTTVNGISMSREEIEAAVSSRNEEINTIQTNEVVPNELILAQQEVKNAAPTAITAPVTTPVKAPAKKPAAKPAASTKSDTAPVTKKTNPAYAIAISNRNKIQGQINSIDSQIAVLAKQADAIRVKFSQRRIDSFDRDKQLYPINQQLSNLAQSKRLTSQGLASIKIPSQYLAQGGMVMPKHFSLGGFARGTDTVPAMLTPGEFIVKKSAVDDFGAKNLKSINNGTYSGDSVYNYSINVNAGTNSSTDDIARAVMAKIKQVDSQRIRGNTF